MDKTSANASLIGAGAGGTLATMVISLLAAFGVILPAEAAAGISAGLALIFGYLIRFLPKPPDGAAAALLPLLIALPLLGACSGAPAGEARDPLTGLHAFVAADLQAAFDGAVAHDDAIAAMCWAWLLEARKAAPEATDVKGAFSALQRARDARRRIQAGLGDRLKLACGPLIADEEGVIARLGVLGARFGLGVGAGP